MILSERIMRKNLRLALQGQPQKLFEFSDVPTPPVKPNPVTDPSSILTDPQRPGRDPADETEFVIAMRRLVDSHPGTDYVSVFQLVKKIVTREEGNQGEKHMKTRKMNVEEALRKHVRAILKEAGVSSAGLASWIGKERPDGGESSKTVRGSGDEQAEKIISALKDEFGLDMSSSQFQNFDKATKLRWFATAWISENDPRFLERTVANYIEFLEESAEEDGLLDEPLIEELKDLEKVLLDDPSASAAFSEFLQSEVTGTIDGMSQEQYDSFFELAMLALDKVPGGVAKYDRDGNLKANDVRDWLGRRQSSKEFTGGGDPLTGGGSAFDRFSAAVDHPKYPPIGPEKKRK